MCLEFRRTFIAEQICEKVLRKTHIKMMIIIYSIYINLFEQDPKRAFW